MDKLKLKVDMLWERDYTYALEHQMKSTLAALSFLKENVIDKRVSPAMTKEYLIHGLSIVWLLVELRLPVSEEELDLMMSVAALHVLKELDPEYSLEQLEKIPSIHENVVVFIESLTKADKQYEIIMDDRLLLITKMAERSNVIEHLCDMTTEEAKIFMIETKRYLFPLCLDGKERYPEFDAALTGILEKMRGLIQVTDILFKRYDSEEDELYEEILNLKEENARIRVALKDRAVTP